MRRFFLVLSAIVSSILFVSLSAPYSASAESVYDDFANTTDSAIIHYGEPCTPIDVSTTYASIMREKSTQFDSHFTTMLEYGAWALTQTAQGYSHGEKYIGLNYVLDSTNYDVRVFGSPGSNDAGFRIYESFSNTHANPYSIILYQGPDCETYVQEGGFSAGVINYRVGSTWEYVQVIYSTFQTLYPAGYEGETIPDTLSPVAPEKLNFEFNYTVNDKQITLNDLSNLSLGQTDCYFQINPNGTQVYSELYFDCETKQSVTHTVDEYGKFDVLLVYVTPDGVKSSIVRTINIDGSNYNGFHTDGNGNAAESALDSFKNFLGSDNGVVSAALLAPLEAIKNINTTTCAPLVIPFLSSSNITIPCTPPALGANTNNLKTSVQLIILGIVMYLVSIGVLAKIKTLSSPEDDRIEVVKL